MSLIALLAGYLIGALPTADGIGRLAGVRLREAGSGNPGANNALQVGGPGLALAVLLVEMTKGVGAALVGAALADDLGAVVGGLGAVAGNVFNIWYRGRGGKGLGIAAGVLLAVWPAVLLPAVIVIALAVFVTRSSGTATLITAVGLLLMALLWAWFDWPTAWGVPAGPLLIGLASGVAALIWNRHWRDSPLSGSSPGRAPESGSPAPR